MYEIFEHTADLGLRIRAATLNDLFADAACGLTALFVADSRSVQSQHEFRIDLVEAELELLLFDWLNELLFRFATQHFLCARFDVHVCPPDLHATVGGETFDPARHRLEHEIKAITYHGLRVEPDDSGWLAEVLVDI